MEKNNRAGFILGILAGAIILPLLVFFGAYIFGGGDSTNDVNMAIEENGSNGNDDSSKLADGNFRANFKINPELLKKIGPGPYSVFMMYGTAENPWIAPREPGNDSPFTGDILFMGKIESFPKTLEGRIFSGPMELISLKAEQQGLKPGLTVSFILGNQKAFYDFHILLGAAGIPPANQPTPVTTLFSARAELLHFPIAQKLKDGSNIVDLGDVVFDEVYNQDPLKAGDGKPSFDPTKCLANGANLSVKIDVPDGSQVSAAYEKSRIVRVYDDFSTFVNSEKMYRNSLAGAPGKMAEFIDDLGEVSIKGGEVKADLKIKKMKMENRFYKLALVSCKGETTAKCLDDFAINYYLKKINGIKDKYLVLVPKNNEVHTCDSKQIEAIFWNDGKNSGGLGQYLLSEKVPNAPKEIVRSVE